MSWKEEAIELLLSGYNKGQISRILAKKYEELIGLPPKVCYEKVRHYLNREKTKEKIRQKGGISNKSPNIKDKTTYSNGITTFEIEKELLKGEEITPQSIMVAKGLKPSEWEVVSYCNNVWQQQTKDGTTIDLYQSKLSVKPLKNKDVILGIKEYFDNNPLIPLANPPKLVYNKGRETLVVDITDLHSGLLSWANETGDNYDLKIMTKRFKECIDDIVARVQPRHFKKIIIATLGDILHTDNVDGKTTKGTEQQTDGRIQKIVKETMACFVYMITTLHQFAPIEYIYTPGNHDELTGFMFAYALEQAFSMFDDITFDTSANPYKARLVGATLLGFTHGEGSKAKNGDWLVNDHRDLFGKCALAEVHEGHLHSQAIKEQTTGVIVKNLPKMCSASAWEHKMGYRSYAAMFCFVYDDIKLHRETWINYI